MKRSVRKVFVAGIVVAAGVSIASLMSLRGVEDFHDKYAGEDLSKDIAGLERVGAYTGYLNAHEGVPMATESVEVPLFEGEVISGDAEVKTNFEGEEKALYTEADSIVSWKVDVPKEGFYNVYMEYFIPQSRGVAAERSLYINGELPFEDARNISFTRIWTNGGEVRVDNQGNQIRPTQVEVFDWQSGYFRDDRGYVADPYVFYFNKGVNEIAMVADNEPMALRKLVVAAVETIEPYAEYIVKQPKVSGGVANFKQVVQGEDSTIRSESSLYAKYDRSSPTTQPNSVTKTILNYVGGEAWRTSGQWIEWDIEVPEDGYYNLMIKARQNYSRGNVSNRSIYIDGKIPFEELKQVSFKYENDWNSRVLGEDEIGIPYQFYLTAGKHTVRMEATLGDLGTILRDLEDSTYRLNLMYRKILVYTGASPDPYRDYHIHMVYPDILEAMSLEAKRLYKIVDDMVEYSGQKADQIATAQTVAQQLERFCEKPNKITTEFINFKDNITALGTASLNLSETKLDVDYLAVTSADVKLQKDEAGFFAKMWHEVKSFVASFIVDYNAVGNVYEGDTKEVVKVWVLTGRDQGTILKAMIDDGFTPDTDIRVNVEVIDPTALLNAVLAGRGPNVVLSTGANQPVNFALRGSVEDLTQFPDLDEVLKPFTASSYEQYRLDDLPSEKPQHLYGLPETQTFNVMFYRKDVLEELGLEVPNTWQELIEMLPTIQGHNLTVAIPTAAGSSTTGAASTAIASPQGDLSMYFTLLYQYGGDMYNENGTKTRVNDEAGVDAFDDYVRYFNDYGIPIIYDFVSRFRSGEMPIGIMPYSTYNTLMVSAPEIRGLWDFTVIPGTERVDENGETYLDRSAFITGSTTMLLKTESESLREKSWKFMKWWASTDTQVRFGREIEALLGSSARYATANKDAFKQLSWSASDIKVLDDQWNQTVGIREVPGGYYTGRHITNAIRKVLNDRDDTRETIIDYSVKIEDEIARKRVEFGMPVE